MPSPFPGMDPYLEDPDIWEDFHASLAAEVRDQITLDLMALTAGAPAARPRQK